MANSKVSPRSMRKRLFLDKLKKQLPVPCCNTMATRGEGDARSPLGRSSSVACDTNIRGHRGSFSKVINRPPAVTEEIQLEGEVLFQGFLRDQIQNEHVDQEVTDEALRNLQAEPSGLDHVDWSGEGAKLRRSADAFAKTQERKNVQRQAAQVNPSNLSSESFYSLLDELFLGGYTQERIVVLFFYCSDLAINALRQRSLEQFRVLLAWIVQYIRDKVCEWVAEHGGWGAVLSGSIQILQWTVAALAVAVAGWSVYRYLRST